MQRQTPASDSVAEEYKPIPHGERPPVYQYSRFYVLKIPFSNPTTDFMWGSGQVTLWPLWIILRLLLGPNLRDMCNLSKNTQVPHR